MKMEQPQTENSADAGQSELSDGLEQFDEAILKVWRQFEGSGPDAVIQFTRFFIGLETMRHRKVLRAARLYVLGESLPTKKELLAMLEDLLGSN